MKMPKLLSRLKPTSISARLALGAVLVVTAALIAASVSTGVVLSRFIRGQIDQRLDAQIASVATALSSQPAVGDDLTVGDPPPFDRMLDGWYWTARIDGRVYRSASLAGGDITIRQPDPGRKPGAPEHDDGRPHSSPGVGPRGEPLHVRMLLVPAAGSWATVYASAPAHALIRPLRDALVPVVLAMLALGVLLAIASYVQLRIGLRPLARLRKDLEDVRTGRSQRIGDDQPRELLPLVHDLNALIVHNAEGIRRARGHVANLGHALNTPLAALSLSLGAGDASGDAERRELVAQMQERIRHHLGRARSAAMHAPEYVSTALKPRVSDLVDVLGKVYADRGLSFTVDVDGSHAVACEQQDLDEMLGNLLDNACKWASQAVSVESRAEGKFIVVTIGDDGPGVEAARLSDVLLAGHRLDETVAGHGFGLPITRELAELYGGSLHLGQSPTGGLRVTLKLPAARDRP